MAQENVYPDFYIISFTFKDDETLTVIPVVSSPTDGYTPIKDTDYDSVADELIKNDFESIIEGIKKFFKIFVLIVGVIILIALIPIFINFVNLIGDFFAGATKTVSEAFKKEPKAKAPRSSSARYKRRRK